jgi:hypothetical protein
MINSTDKSKPANDCYVHDRNGVRHGVLILRAKDYALVAFDGNDFFEMVLTENLVVYGNLI